VANDEVKINDDIAKGTRSFPRATLRHSTNPAATEKPSIERQPSCKIDSFKYCQPSRKPNGEEQQNNVEYNGERKLNPRQKESCPGQFLHPLGWQTFLQLFAHKRSR
jgi:hypothetical protein